MKSGYSTVYHSKALHNWYAFFTFYGYITNLLLQSDQLLVGLIAQLVEHCTGIADVSRFANVVKLHKCIELTVNQICLKIFCLAVDKRTKNDLKMH